MNKVNNEDKQNLNSIKFLYKLNTEGQIPTLFHEVKKAKQQAFNISNAIKERLLEIRKQFEEEQKQFVKAETNIDVVEHESKVERSTKRVQEDEKSFAELFASSIAGGSEDNLESDAGDLEDKKTNSKQDSFITADKKKEEVVDNKAEKASSENLNIIKNQNVVDTKVEVSSKNDFRTQKPYSQPQNSTQFRNNNQRQPYQNANTQNKSNFYQKQYNSNYQNSRENNLQSQNNNNFQRKQYIPNQNYNNRFNNQNRFQQRPSGSQNFQ